MTRLALFAALPLLATACAAEDSGATAQAAAEVAPAPAAAEPVLTRIDYDAVLAGDHRSEENRARDPYRRPAETLAFFGLEPGMTVVEINPGGGWYTEVLAPAVGPEGKLYAAQVDPAASERAAKRIADYDAKLASNPAYVNTERVVFWNKSLDMPDGVADMVVTFRNVHNWHMRDEAEAAFAEFHAALKPGGILGVVEHRLPETADDELMQSSGYMKQSTVVEMAEAAGFTLVEASEINANPADTADYPKGVWTLPPRFAEGDVDRAKYAEIGESDRMTLKFRKAS